MWYLCLDESGDLGFDFVNKKPSKFFTICLLVANDASTYYGIRRAIRKTLRRKVNQGGEAKHLKEEIKATGTNLGVKRYFYQQVQDLPFELYALTLDKRRQFERLTREKERIYNFIARLVMDHVPFERADNRVQLIVDRSMGRSEILEFNKHIFRQLQGRLSPKIPLHIDHTLSHEEPALQAADLFAWGIFHRYEHGDATWRAVFKAKIRYDELYQE